MGELVELRRIKPPVTIVCGFYVFPVDDEWWVSRWSTAAERRAGGLHFVAVDGPCETSQEAERCARRRALRPLAQPKEPHGT